MGGLVVAPSFDQAAAFSPQTVLPRHSTTLHFHHSRRRQPALANPHLDLARSDLRNPHQGAQYAQQNLRIG